MPMTLKQCEKIVMDHCKKPRGRCEGCVLITVALRVLELLSGNRTKKTDGITQRMAIKAHEDIMEKGQACLKDPTIDKELKKLIRQEMENSKLCMDAFGLNGEVKA